MSSESLTLWRFTLSVSSRLKSQNAKNAPQRVKFLKLPLKSAQPLTIHGSRVGVTQDYQARLYPATTG